MEHPNGLSEEEAVFLSRLMGSRQDYTRKGFLNVHLPLKKLYKIIYYSQFLNACHNFSRRFYRFGYLIIFLH